MQSIGASHFESYELQGKDTGSVVDYMGQTLGQKLAPALSHSTALCALRTKPNGSNGLMEVEVEVEGEGNEDDTDFEGKSVVHLGFQLLVAALGSTEPAFVALLEPIISVFFPEVVLEVVLALYFNDVVPKKAKAGALLVIADYISSLSEKDEVSLTLMLAIELAGSIAVCDKDIFVRSAAITLAEHLSELPATLSLQGDKTLPKVSPSDLIYFGTTIAALSTTITIDHEAASAAFSAKIMASYSIEPLNVKDKASHGRVQAQMLYLAVTCAKDAPHVSRKLVRAANATPLDLSWPYFEELMTAFQDNVEGDLLVETLLQAIDNASSASAGTQKAIVEWMTANIGKGTQSLLCKKIISLLRGNWTACLSDHKEKEALLGTLFHSLLQEQLTRPGQESVLEALKSIKIGPAGLLEPFHTALEALEEGMASIDINKGGVEEASAVLARPLQQVASLAEAATIKLTAEGDDYYTVNSSTPTNLCRLLLLTMDVLTATCHEALGSVLGIEYTRSLLMDLASYCLIKVPVAMYTTSEKLTSAKKGARRGKVPSSAVEAGYTLDRVKPDIEMTLNCLGASRTAQTQISAIKLVRALAAIQPSCAPDCIRTLGNLLSSAAVESQAVGFAFQGDAGLGIVGEVLNSLVGLMASPQGPLILHLRNWRQSCCHRTFFYRYVPTFLPWALPRRML